MRCPRCQSSRIQRGYNDTSILVRLAGRHELLCNNCGLEFTGYKWSAAFQRVPGKSDTSKLPRRRAPRYKAHLPATIRLVNTGTNNEPSFSPAMRGHCQTISSIGMALSFVGSRIDPAEFAKPGRLLLVVINLTGSAIEAVVKTITHDRIENKDGSPANWFVGTSIVQIAEADRSQLLSYLERRSVD
jgi:hypothetical protein